jgi:hypothetical protein
VRRPGSSPNLRLDSAGESDARATGGPPSGLEIVDDRRYGRARIVLLRA